MDDGSEEAGIASQGDGVAGGGGVSITVCMDCCMIGRAGGGGQPTKGVEDVELSHPTREGAKKGQGTLLCINDGEKAATKGAEEENQGN